MKRVKLGKSDIEVSQFCLGTMTFGNQTPEPDAHAQMDRAKEAGITFFDCAEMYPVNPVTAETAGRSESFIGNWLARTGGRDGLELATKIAGPGGKLRGGEGINRRTVRAAVEASLKRLQTDYIDLYQLHWPERGSYAFRQNWSYDPSDQNPDENRAHMEEVLGELQKLVDEGKLRGFGLSNETAWGTMRWIDTAERTGGPRVLSVQNEYSLLYRLYDLDSAETAVNEGVTLLSYSPLAAGLLTGKYQDGNRPEGSRAAVDLSHGGPGNLGGRLTDRARDAVASLDQLAREHGTDLVALALNWQIGRPFPVVPILGATTDAQLSFQLERLGQEVSADLRKEVDKLNRQCPMPY
ncbi:MAG: aldo/keto reductase [Paracoccus sp. (in: a-proteobacteria)]|nr:aldo/keto reductase [Paracoccus sp. (in: a-proteobacteria)]